MRSLREGIDAVQRNLSALFIYLAILVVVSLLFEAIKLKLGITPQTPLDSEPWRKFLLIYLGPTPLVAALAHTFVFCRIAKEMDSETVITFDTRAVFVVWLIVNLALYWSSAINNVLFMVTFTMALPCGALWMYSRTRSPAEPADLAETAASQFPQILAVICACGCVCFFLNALLLSNATPVWVSPLRDVILGYFDCVLFAAMWHICLSARDEADEL